MRHVLPILLALPLACGPSGESAEHESDHPLRAESLTCAASDPRAEPVTIEALPDAGEAAYTRVLSGATKSISVMIYMMGRGQVFDTLVAKARAGVDVRVIFDGNEKREYNTPRFDELVAAGGKAKWSDPSFPYMHAKFLLIDGREVALSTGNFAATQIADERNFVAHDTDPADVAAISELFENDWNGRPATAPCGRVLFAPLNAHQPIVDLIASAQSEVVVESMQLSDRAVQDALYERRAAGVKVWVIIADPQWLDSNYAVSRYLKDHGIWPRTMSEPRVHVKAVVVDSARAYVGSENMSTNSLDRNREVGLLVSDEPAVRLMRETFAKDWERAREL
jgi:cardiolipin synthase